MIALYIKGEKMIKLEVLKLWFDADTVSGAKTLSDIWSEQKKTKGEK